IRDLHPLEKYTCLEHCLTKIICNFEILLLLAAGALCSCRAHTKCINHWADSANFKGVTFNKLRSGLTGKCFEMPNASYTNRYSQC
ncbi:MAG: hypothetical protein RBR39_12980, partial [Proteiniphilum sp.]|nr:hypothetical protein [Proteiniphilum sp.]